MSQKTNFEVLSQISLASDIVELLKDKYGITETNSRQINALYKASSDIANEFNRKTQHAYSDMGISKWLASDDVGKSSKFVASYLMYGNLINAEYAHPYDPSDAGRIIRLLDACPELVPVFPKMADASPQWKSLVENWAEIVMKIEEKDGSSAYDLIMKCLKK